MADQMRILGFKLEIHENRFVKGDEIANEQTISCQYNIILILKIIEMEKFGIVKTKC